MGLNFNGNPPAFSGKVVAEVPTPTYSGKKSSDPDDSINPYTTDGPGEGGGGLTEDQIDDIQGGVEPGVALIPLMTSATAPSGTATWSSEWTAGLQGWHAFDDPDTGTIWLSGIGVSGIGFIAYEFAAPTTTPLSYIIKASINGENQRALKDWTFEGWNGATWDVLDTVTNETGWTTHEERTFTVDDPASYAKYRLNITDSNDSGGQGFVSVAQWQLYTDDQNA